jgi:hypothetical protein
MALLRVSGRGGAWLCRVAQRTEGISSHPVPLHGDNAACVVKTFFSPWGEGTLQLPAAGFLASSLPSASGCRCRCGNLGIQARQGELAGRETGGFRELSSRILVHPGRVGFIFSGPSAAKAWPRRKSQPQKRTRRETAPRKPQHSYLGFTCPSCLSAQPSRERRQPWELPSLRV